MLNRIFFYLWFDHADATLINDEWISIPQNKRKIPYSTPNPPSDIESLRENERIVFTSKRGISELNSSGRIVQSKSMYETIEELLKSAKKSIDIAVYSLYLFSDKKLETLKTELIDKVEDSVDIRILVPSVKVTFSQPMRKLLDELKAKGISVRYYRELHGKCLIIDRKKVLMMTGNIDKYLISDDSFDIGFILESPLLVGNYSVFYDHLWGEAASELNLDTAVNLHLEMTIRAYELIAFKTRVSVKRLEELIKQSKSITLFLIEDKGLLRVTGHKGRFISVYFEMKDSEMMDYSSDVLTIIGMINDNPHMNLKEALHLTVEKLELKLLWES